VRRAISFASFLARWQRLQQLCAMLGLVFVQRNGRNARIDIASVPAFWPLHRLRQLRTLQNYPRYNKEPANKKQKSLFLTFETFYACGQNQKSPHVGATSSLEQMILMYRLQSLWLSAKRCTKPTKSYIVQVLGPMCSRLVAAL